jgi:redox-sensitive bicupin YhaK (pirin superfamily)
MNPNDAVTVPNVPFLHLFVARGDVDLEGVGILNEGDAVRLTGVDGQSLTAFNDAEVLIWEMHARTT